MSDWPGNLDSTAIGRATKSDARGMHSLLNALPVNPAKRAAQLLATETRPIIVCTGFPVGGAPETDGPPGSLALIDALQGMGKKARLMSWRGAIEIFSKVRNDIDYLDLNTVAARGETLKPDSATLKKCAIVTVEICAQCADGSYRNIHGVDIRDVAPRFEAAIGLHALLSLGDGGNEFGMGNAPDAFFKQWKIRKPLSTCDCMVPAATSNYGCYAIIRELELVTGLQLLPAPSAHEELIASLVAAGCVDGISAQKAVTVDGDPVQMTTDLIADLSNISA